MPVELGLYKHFKGNLYEVIGNAYHSETLEEMVVYKALYGEGRLWVRPISMFFDKKIDGLGLEVIRFKKIDDERND